MPDLIQKFGLGTVQFGMDYGISNVQGQVPKEQVSKIIDYFRSCGGRVLDTASAYGSAEEVLGGVDLSSFDVVSKWMPPVEGQSIQELLEQSLTKLKVKKLYAYLAHRPRFLLDHPERWLEVVELKKKGWVQKNGVSLNRPEELTELIELGIVPDLIQVPFNYFDHRFDAVCSSFKKNGGEIHTRSAFLQGLFFLPPESLSKHFDDIKPILKNLRHDFSNLTGELLYFSLQNRWADVVIIGVVSKEQLKQNIKSVGTTQGLPVLEKSVSDSILNPSNWYI